ncbi:MAG: DUF2637 domain-containing protein [Bifidobacteriaceae bacterium]|nr:DUF2637 domain-containing protein [Bifidobacteriaceae bacterium]
MLGTGIAGTVLVACLAFLLSFTALTRLAGRAGVAAGLGWAWPLIVDGTIVVATVAVVALRDRRGQGYAWLLLVCGALVSVTANAVQAAMPAGAALPAGLAAAVCSVPPVVLLAITHLTVVLARRQPVGGGPPARPAPPAGGGDPAAGGLVGEAAGGPVGSWPVGGGAPGGGPAGGAGRAGGAGGPDAPTGADDGAVGGGIGLAGGGRPPGAGVSGPVVEGLSDGELRSLLAGLGRDGPGGAQGGGGDGVGEGARTWQVEEARRLKADGLTNRAIAGRLGVNPATVGRWLKTTTTGAENA